MEYRFGTFAYEPGCGLTQDGMPVPMEPMAEALLAHLLANQGRIVTREELQDALWDGRIVTDAAISTQIRAVRRVLGDDGQRQAFVKTHPRRGFSFVGAVTDLDDAPGLDQIALADGQDNRARRQFGGRRNVFVAFAAVAAVLLAIVVSAFDSGDATGPADGHDLSVIVLPFDNLSGDPRKDYLADAFTEDLITDLSRIRDAFVISRSTSFTYRGQSVDAAAVADELGVRYVLEGSLRIEGDRVSINVQLIDGESSSHIWADRYESALPRLFHVQDNVTGRIASVLRAELRIADNGRQGPEPGTSAWDHALRGNVLLYNHETITDYQEAHRFLSRAVELDPGIASAWGGLAFVHLMASFGTIPGVTQPDSARLSLEAALKATEADPMNAEPYWLVGAGYARIGQPERGMPACRTAIDLNPNMDCGHVCAGLVHMSLGEPEKAIPYFKQALALNPRFRPFTKQKYLGLAYLQIGEDDLAIAALNTALSLVPKDGFANLVLASALAHQQRLDEARSVLDAHVAHSAGISPTLKSIRKGFGWLGPGVDRLIAGLQMVGLS